MARQLTAQQQQDIFQIQRNLGLPLYEAVLGNGAGQVVDLRSNGFNVWVRFQSANNTGFPQSVRKPIYNNVAMADGTACWVGYWEGELAVLGPRLQAQKASGTNGIINSTQTDPTGGFIELSLSKPLRSQPTTPPSLKVTVKSLWYIHNNLPVNFPGDGGFDLEPSIPASAGKQCLALVYLDQTDNTLKVVTSTPISSAKGFAAFGSNDIEECVTAAGTTNVKYSKFWQLIHGMTKITDANDYLDFRYLLVPDDSGSGSIADATVSNAGKVLVDVPPVSNTPIAVTATRLGSSDGVALLAGDKRVPSFQLPYGPNVDVAETDRWVRHPSNPVFTASETWEEDVVSEPNVFYDNGVWTMFYTAGWNTVGIGLATSTDGVTWTKEVSNPVFGAGVGEAFAAHTGMLKHNGLYYLYYTDLVINANLKLATSSDGLTWTIVGTVIAHNAVGWSNGWANSAVWIEQGNQWKMMLEGYNGSYWFISHWTSEDGLTWTPNAAEALTDLQIEGSSMYGGPMVPFPYKIDDTYYLYYHAGYTGGVLPTRLYHASSKDLVNWTVIDDNPLLTLTDTFEVDQVADAHVIEVNGKCYFYYEGFDNDAPAASIGLLTFDGGLATLVKRAGKPVYLDENDLIPSAYIPGGGGGGGGGGIGDYILIREEKTQSSSGGTFTSGAWQTRVLNTEVSDPGGHATISSNQITLAAGTYRIHARAPARLVDQHQARLYNVSDSSVTLLGTSEYSPSGVDTPNSWSVILGRFTISGTKTFEIQHKCVTTRSSDGFGTAGTLATEIYTSVELIKE